MARRCLRCWYNTYVLKLSPVTDMSYADAGKVVHECLELHYKNIPLNDIKTAFKVKWKNRHLDTSIIKDKEDSYFLMIINGINKNIPLTSVELKIFYDDIVGYLDGINTTTDEIHDWKTSTISDESKEEYTLQMSLYSYLYYRRFNRIPKRCVVHYLKYNNSNGELIITPTMETIIEAEDWHFKTRQMIMSALETRKFPKCTDNNIQCFYFCPFKENCENDEFGELKLNINILGHFMQILGPISPLLNKGLDKKFSYTLKEAYFIQQARPGYDGVIRFWNEKKRLLPIGFYKELMKTLNDYTAYKKLSLNLQIKDMRREYKKMLRMPDEFINNVKLRDYQLQAVEEYLRQKIAILEIGTGGGKSEIAIECIRRLGCKTLFIVDKIELLRQTKKRIEDSLGIEVGEIGAGEDNIKDVSVATIQTLAHNLDKYSQYLQNIDFAIFDECVSQDTMITLADGTRKCIKDICEDEKITKVLSYNEDKKIFEPKSIIRKIKTKMEENWYHLLIEDELGNKHKLCVTSNHKIWTTKGYKQIKDLTHNDILKVYLESIIYKCYICNKESRNPFSIGGHINAHLHPDLLSLAGQKGSKILTEKRKDKNFNDFFINKIKKTCIERSKTEAFKNNNKKMSIDRKGKNNVVYRLGIKEKIRKTQKQNFANLSKEKQEEIIKRFMEAPRFRWNKNPTKPEQKIIDMKIKNLEYVGKGDKVYYFLDGKRKIPDFKLKNENKVIEVGDFDYWHTEEEKEYVIKEYKKIDVECLYLDANNIDESIIKKFCYNHNARIVSIKKARRNKYCINGFKYNLEIEDNHNYIANKIVVSNCHHVSSRSYVRIANHLANTQYRLGISGTARRDDGNDMAIFSVTGYKCFDLGAKILIDRGWLVKPNITFLKINMDEKIIKEKEQKAKQGLINETKDYHSYYREFISENEIRNQKIVDLVNKNRDKRILILTKLVAHGEMLATILQAVHLHGTTNKEIRKSILEDFKSGKINIIVSTISIFSEGIDLPQLNFIINAAANTGDVKTIQILGRELRKGDNKHRAQYLDFIDEGYFFTKASRARIRAFKREGHEVETSDM